MNLKIYIPTFFLSFFLCFTANIVLAQLQPCFFIKQKSDGLQSNTVYNIHAAKNGLLYIAHSKGISSFDGIFFKNYPNKNYPYTELSNLLETTNGEIFCKAFNNVLYKINGDSAEKVAYYPSDYGYMVSTCYENTILSMGRDTIFFYDALSKKTIKTRVQNVSYTNIPSNIIFGGYAPIHGVMHLFFVDKKLNVYKVKSTEEFRGNMHFSKGDCFMTKDKSVEKIYHLNKRIILPIKAQNPNTIVNYITIVDSFVWICTTNGVYYYNKYKGASFAQYILKGYNTTDVNKTFENNYVISTIGNGLIMIPSFNINYLPNVPTPISSLTGNDNTLYMGTKNGKIIQYNTNNFSQSLIEKSNEQQPVLFLLHDKFRNIVLNSSSINLGTTHSNRSKLLIKDYTYVGNELLLATNAGMYVFSDKSINSWIKNYVIQDSLNTNNLKRLSLFNEYVATVKYDKFHDKLFASTYSGLFEIANGDTYPKKLPEPNCVLKDMACYNGLLYLATKDQGILIWDGKSYLPLKENNPTHDILLKFETYENELWVLGENAIYCYTKNDFKVYDKKFGIDLEQTLNIYIAPNDVYVNNGESIISFPKKISKTVLPKPKFILHSIVSRKQKKEIKPNAILTYDDNTININFSLIAFANGLNTHLAYSINNQEMLHLQSNTRQIDLNNLMPNKYTIHFFVVSNDVISSSESYKLVFEITPPFYKTWWFNVLLILATIAITYSIFKTTLNRWKRNSLLKESKLLLEKELDKSMLTSIKAQMNPHFLFNALNTIQSYIYMNDKQNASIYISKFSDLTRSILDMSTKETISLEEEIHSMKLYLELEKMRFEDSFNYDIIVSSTLNKDTIKIPSMLVQPYIENAIKHGLLHKKTNRFLQIEFTRNKNLLQISIDDNGIGRKRSDELNKIKNKQHTSFAMNANKKRLEILKNNIADIEFNIVDKVSDLGEPTGTLVVISLPI
jgi:sensor histidine kinase YesM/ligand-binding sensor domain-containing protein